MGSWAQRTAATPHWPWQCKMCEATTLPCKNFSSHGAVSSLVVGRGFAGHSTVLSAASAHRGTNSTENDLGRVHHLLQSRSRQSRPLGPHSLFRNQGAMGIGRPALLNNGGWSRRFFSLKASCSTASDSFEGFFPAAAPAPFPSLGYWRMDCGSSLGEGAREF